MRVSDHVTPPPEEPQARHVEFSFIRGQEERPPPRSVVVPPLESLGATSIETTKRGAERLHLSVDGTSIWVQLEPELSGVSCLVPANGSPQCLHAVRSIIGHWETASPPHLGGEIRFAEDSFAPSELYLRGHERRREFDRMLVLRKASFELRWDCRQPVEGDVAASDAILGGDTGAVAPLMTDPNAAELVSRECARRLFERADASFEQRRTEEPLWARAQEAVTELAKLEWSLSHHLAIALLEASLFETYVATYPDGHTLWKRMKREPAAWLSRAIPRRIAWELDNRHTGGSADVTSLRHAMWNLPGHEGTHWVSRLMRNDERLDELVRAGLGTSFDSDRWPFDDGESKAWDEHDAVERLDAIADAAPRASYNALAALTPSPPSYTAIAQCRVADAHSTEPGPDRLVELAARNIGGYLSGDVSDDVDLFEWDAPPERRATVRWLLELAAGTDGRGDLVSEALRVGHISPADAAFLSAPIETYVLSSDEDAPWELDPPSDLGEIDVPDGLLAGGSALEEAAWTIAVPPGSHLTRLVMATHPVRPQANAALEILFDRDAEIASWELIPGEYSPEGFSVEFGVGLVGAPAGFERDETFEKDGGDAAFEPLYGGLGGVTVTAGTGVRLVAFSVAPQNAMCRSWVGRDADGTTARLVFDLDIAGLDPAANGVPWD